MKFKFDFEKYKYFLISLFVISGGLWYSYSAAPYDIKFIPKDINYYNTVQIKENFEAELYENSLINVNSDSIKELMKLDGIGKVTAEKIIDYRKENGDFTQPEGIINVKGISEKTYDKIKDRLTV